MSGYMIQSRATPSYFARFNALYGDSVRPWHDATVFPNRDRARVAMGQLRRVSPGWVKTWKLRIVKVRLTIEARR